MKKKRRETRSTILIGRKFFTHTKEKKESKKKSIMISRRTVKRLNVYRVLTLSTRP